MILLAGSALAASRPTAGPPGTSPVLRPGGYALPLGLRPGRRGPPRRSGGNGGSWAGSAIRHTPVLVQGGPHPLHRPGWGRVEPGRQGSLRDSAGLTPGSRVLALRSLRSLRPLTASRLREQRASPVILLAGSALGPQGSRPARRATSPAVSPGGSALPLRLRPAPRARARPPGGRPGRQPGVSPRLGAGPHPGARRRPAPSVPCGLHPLPEARASRGPRLSGAAPRGSVAPARQDPAVW